jgi:hypothetical protein
MLPSPSGKAGAVSVIGDPTGKHDCRRRRPAARRAGDRVDDPAYVVAYQSCMRQKGF